MKRIIVETIDGGLQRYPTCGDYWETPDEIHFRITKQGNDKHEFLILLHEMIEFMLTKEHNIPESVITMYDKIWEQWKNKGIPLADEPGNQDACPYKKEHRFSENIERQVAHELGIDWFEYENSLIV